MGKSAKAHLVVSRYLAHEVFNGGAFAIANHLAGPHELMEFPVSHSDRPEEQLWKHFETYWLRLTRDGIPSEFGSGHAPSATAPV